MPVILEDDMLLPPSLRRQGYHVNGIDSSNSTTTTIEVSAPRSRGHSRGPIVIHEDHYVPVYGEEITREYIIAPGGGSSTYRRGGELDVGFNRGARYNRARSVGQSGYESYESNSDEYYVEDGSRHGGRRHRHRHESPDRQSNSHRGRRIAEVGAAAAVTAYGAHQLHEHMKNRSQSQHRSSSHHTSEGGNEHPHRARHIAEGAVAAAGLKHAMNNHRQRSHSRGRRGSEGAIYGDERHPGWNDDNHRDHRRAKHLAEAGLGIAAAGAAKEIYDHRKHNQRRSSSTGSLGSPDRHQESHNGRHVAAAALGATAAGLAHHKMHQHKERRSSSVSSYSSDEERPRHMGRKVAGAAIGAAAAGVAGKALYDHYYRRSSRSRSRSRSRSSSSEGRRKQHHSKLPAAALGTAAVLAAKHHHDHKHDGSRSRSRSRDRHGPNNTQKAAYMMAGALAEKHHRKKHHEREEKRSLSADGHREHRHRRGSESSGYGKHNRSRRGSTAGGAYGGIISNMMGGARGNGEAPPRERGLGEKVAYKLGELAAEEIAARRMFGKDKERR